MPVLRKTILLFVLAVLFCESAQARFCFIRSFPVAFGNYMPATPVSVDSTGRIRVICIGRPRGSQGNFYTLSIDSGFSGDVSSRRMQSGSNRLAYNLYKDPARTRIWGDGNGGATPLVQPINRFFQVRNVPVYGRLFANQDPVPGRYSDTVFVTIEF